MKDKEGGLCLASGVLEVLYSSSIRSRRDFDYKIKLSRVRADIKLGFPFYYRTKVSKYLRLRILSHSQTCSFGQSLRLDHHISEGEYGSGCQDVRFCHPCKRQEFFAVMTSCLSHFKHFLGHYTILMARSITFVSMY